MLKRPIRYQRMVGPSAAAEVVVCLSGKFRLCPVRHGSSTDRHGIVSPISAGMNLCSIHMSSEQDPKPQIPAFIRRVMPDASSADLDAAAAAFARYLNGMLRLYTRLKQQRDSQRDSREGKTYARVARDKQERL